MTERSVYRKVLEDIFDLSDLDGNGTMSREEFNWYNIRTSEEEVGDDEWEVVEGTWDNSLFVCLTTCMLIYTSTCSGNGDFDFLLLM